MLVVAAAGVALVEAAPVGPVLDAADGAQWGGRLGLERMDDQAVEQAADLSGGQRDGPAVAGVVPGIGAPRPSPGSPVRPRVCLDVPVWAR